MTEFYFHSIKKNSVKSTHLVTRTKGLLSRNFAKCAICFIFFWNRSIHCVEKREIHCHAFFFFWSNQFAVKFFSKIFRNLTEILRKKWWWFFREIRSKSPCGKYGTFTKTYSKLISRIIIFSRKGKNLSTFPCKTLQNRITYLN